MALDRYVVFLMLNTKIVAMCIYIRFYRISLLDSTTPLKLDQLAWDEQAAGAVRYGVTIEHPSLCGGGGGNVRVGSKVLAVHST